MYVFGDQSTDLRSFKPSSESPKPAITHEESSDTFNDAILDGTDIFICLVLSQLNMSKDQAMTIYSQIPDSVKNKLGDILLNTTHNVLMDHRSQVLG